MEDQRRRQQPPSEMEVIRRAERDAHTAKASAALQDQRDEVKAMNAMLAYAKCAAIRWAARPGGCAAARHESWAVRKLAQGCRLLPTFASTTPSPSAEQHAHSNQAGQLQSAGCEPASSPYACRNHQVPSAPTSCC